MTRALWVESSNLLQAFPHCSNPDQDKIVGVFISGAAICDVHRTRLSGTLYTRWLVHMGLEKDEITALLYATLYAIKKERVKLSFFIGGISRRLFVLFDDIAVCHQADCIDPDEPFRIFLVVSTLDVHRRQILVVEGGGARPCHWIR